VVEHLGKVQVKEYGKHKDYGECNRIREIIKIIDEVFDVYYDADKEKYVITQVNNMITSENFNAARGYMLAKELQGCNLEIVKIEEQLINELPIITLAKDQANKIRIERNRLLKQLLITHRNRNKNLDRMLRAVI
jgi:hypothetical protein